MSIFRKIVKEVSKPVVNNYKGRVGEAKVNSALNPFLFGKVNHRQINNLILTDERGKTHEIDHVEIRTNGVFCIETKNYKGWIFGSREQHKWTQTLYNQKHQFLNPLKQNKSHLYYLNKVLGEKYKAYSLVVFVQNNANRVNEYNVINLIDLKSYLNNFDCGTRYTNEEMNEIEAIIRSAASKNVSNREHVYNIRRTQSDIDRGICPRCGGVLVKKSGRYGDFFGCNRYPKCKFILKN